MDRWSSANRACATSTTARLTARTRSKEFGKHAAEALKRLDKMSNCGDLVVISMLDHDTDQVAAFEELIGSHGGLGGPQTEPLILYPSEWQLEKEPLVGAPQVYGQLMAWLGKSATATARRPPPRRQQPMRHQQRPAPRRKAQVAA